MIATLPMPLPETAKAMWITAIEAGDSEIDKLYPTGGYKSFGHFCHEVIAADGYQDVHAMGRLVRWKQAATKAATGLGIQLEVLADYFVPVEFSSSIYSRLLDAEYDLFARVRRQTIRGNKAYLWAEDDADRNDAGSRLGGVAVTWLDEGDPIPESRPERGRLLSFHLHKLAALVNVTNELIEDSEGRFESAVDERVARAMSWEIGRVIFEGKGGARPLGAYAPGNKALLTAEKESGQLAKTVTRRNLITMAATMPAGHLTRAVWHCNPDVLPVIYELQDSAPGLQLLTAGPAGYGNLLNKPLVPLDYCEPLGTQGDITFQDWDAYQVVFKGQTRRDVSMHARFRRDEASLRFTFRMDGKPLWNKPMTPYKGSRLASPFITLASRA